MCIETTQQQPWQARGAVVHNRILDPTMRQYEDYEPSYSEDIGLDLIVQLVPLPNTLTICSQM